MKKRDVLFASFSHTEKEAKVQGEIPAAARGGDALSIFDNCKGETKPLIKCAAIQNLYVFGKRSEYAKQMVSSKKSAAHRKKELANFFLRRQGAKT